MISAYWGTVFSLVACCVAILLASHTSATAVRALSIYTCVALLRIYAHIITFNSYWL